MSEAVHLVRKPIVDRDNAPGGRRSADRRIRAHPGQRSGLGRRTHIFQFCERSTATASSQVAGTQTVAEASTTQVPQADR